jgi:hypothetical protein
MKSKKLAYIFVEDNKDAHKHIRELWKKLRNVRKSQVNGEYNLIIAKDYNEAIAALNSSDYDRIMTVVTDIFFPQETGSGKREMAKEIEEEIQIALDERMAKDNFYCALLYQDAVIGLREWATSKNEAEQPLGLKIIKECAKRNIRFCVATSFNHHNKKVEGVFQAIYAADIHRQEKYGDGNSWQCTYEIQSYKDEEEADKGNHSYWEGLFGLFIMAGGIR